MAFTQSKYKFAPQRRGIVISLRALGVSAGNRLWSQFL